MKLAVVLVAILISTPGVPAERGMVMATNGMAASMHPLASKVGIDVLESGGGAADAAVAMAAVLSVVEPQMSGLGADAIILYYSARDGKVYGLNSSGRAPQNASFEYFTDNGFETMPRRGIHTVTVPGALAGWTMLLDRFGTRPLSELLRPAIRYAEEGVPVNEWLYKWYHTIRLEHESARAAYYIDGRIPELGEVLVQKNLAETYRKIAAGGREVFYGGEIAEAIVRTSRAEGGFLTVADFREHRSEWVEPLATDYRGFTVLGFPPNTQGLTLLQQLNILSELDLASMGHNSTQAIHTMVEAKKLAFADRDHFIADPKTTSIPVEELLSKSYAVSRAAMIDPNKAAPHVTPGDPDPVNTTYFNVVDSRGNAVSFITSLKTPWGSQLVAGDTGILLQNRGNGFSLDPEHPNRFTPGSRPFHTINPAMVMKNGKPYMILGCAGGNQQTIAMVQVLVNVLDFGMNIQDAIEAKRWTHLDGTRIALETDLSVAERSAFAQLGHVIVTNDDPDVYWGDCQVIRVDAETGTLFGGSESRASGAALGY